MGIYIVVIAFYTESRSPNDVLQPPFVLHGVCSDEQNEIYEVGSFRVPLA